MPMCAGERRNIRASVGWGTLVSFVGVGGGVPLLCAKWAKRLDPACFHGSMGAWHRRPNKHMSTGTIAWGMGLIMSALMSVVLQSEVLAMSTIACTIIWHGWRVVDS